MTAPTTAFFKTAPAQPAFLEEVPIRAFEPLRPYPQNPSAIIYRARFMQLRAYYSRPVVNTPHPDLPQVYFADDVDFQDRPGGLLEWTRIWNTLPNSWTDFESTSYSFPGFLGTRVPLVKTVTARLTYDYYLVGALPNFTGNLTNYDNFNAAEWIKFGTTTTPNFAVPACAGGGNYATELVDDNGAGPAQQFYVKQATTQGGGTAQWATVFVKRDTSTGNGNAVRIAIVNNAAPDVNTNQATFDIRTGELISNTAGDTPFIAAIGDGWWRIGLRALAAIPNAALAVALCQSNGNPNYIPSTLNPVLVWRGQVGTGNSIPHSTVPPTTTPDSANYPVQTADLIPVKFGQTYLYNLLNIAFEYLSNATTPTYANYNANVVADLNANSYSVEANDSLLSLWDGSTWARQRRFVKAR